jgi:hypothetical protein
MSCWGDYVSRIRRAQDSLVQFLGEGMELLGERSRLDLRLWYLLVRKPLKCEDPDGFRLETLMRNVAHHAILAAPDVNSTYE